jgi:hypothetical protein
VHIYSLRQAKINYNTAVLEQERNNLRERSEQNHALPSEERLHLN